MISKVRDMTCFLGLGLPISYSFLIFITFGSSRKYIRFKFLAGGISLWALLFTGGCDVHLHFCDPSIDSCWNCAGAKLSWHTQLPMSHQCCASSHSWEKMVSKLQIISARLNMLSCCLTEPKKVVVIMEFVECISQVVKSSMRCAWNTTNRPTVNKETPVPVNGKHKLEICSQVVHGVGVMFGQTV